MAEAFIGAALPEEAFKLIALIGICGSRLGQMPASRILVIGVATGCGFAALENIYYVVADDQWIGIAILRCITAVPGHAFIGAVMGACVARAMHGRHRVVWWGLAYLAPVLLHGIYNFWFMAIEGVRAAGQAGPPGLTEWLVIGFIATVIVEDALAHTCLWRALRYDAPPPPQARTGTPLPATLQWLARPRAAVVFWSLVSGVFLLASAGGVVIAMQDRMLTGDPSNLWLIRGYSAFAMLHALAFASLAIVLWRGQAGRGCFHDLTTPTRN